MAALELTPGRRGPSANAAAADVPAMNKPNPESPKFADS